MDFKYVFRREYMNEKKSRENTVLAVHCGLRLGTCIYFFIPFASLKAQTSYEKMLYLSTI